MRRCNVESSEAFVGLDTTFKMYSDTPSGKDPDTNSPTLQSYHRFLWSKPLPSGKILALTPTQSRPYYLSHHSELGDFCLSSDSFVHTYARWKRRPIVDIVNAIPKKEIDSFYDLGSTIGGYIVFPKNKVKGKRTLNGERGINRQIGDRFDLTLECIHRWYDGIESPLFACIDRYRDFFVLFEDFKGYVEFFLLQDLVDAASGSIRFWLPFESFGKRTPLPVNLEEYREYMGKLSAFTEARNSRIEQWASRQCTGTFDFSQQTMLSFE